MVRAILAAIVGFVAFYLAVFTTFSVAYVAMGTERAFVPESYDVSTLWMISTFVLGFAAAVGGGLVCAMIARDQRATLGLAVICLLFGILPLTASLAMEDESPVRAGDVSGLDAMNAARTPVWAALVFPVLSAAGVVLGGRLRRGGPGTPASA